MSEPCRRLKGGTMVTRSLTFGFLMLVAGCDGDSFDDEIESTQLASGTWPVTWVRTAGVAVNGNSLTKTGPIGWNAGARSFELAGSGYVEFTTAENNTAKMVGLSSDDTGTGYAEIAFAIRLKRNGRVSVFEQGVLQVEDMTTYLPGDVFRVEVEAAGFGIAVVTYSKNGVVFHSRAILSDELLDYPMFLVDTSLYTPGATINNVVLVSTQVTWQNTVNVGVFSGLWAGSGIWKVAGGSAWNAGASSTDTISGDGYVEFSVDQESEFQAAMAGLSNGDNGVGAADIDFAIRLKRNGKVAVFENGVLKADNLTTYATGDRFRVQVTAGVVTYSKNGTLLYTSTATPAFPLLVDTSIFSPGDRTRHVVLVAR